MKPLHIIFSLIIAALMSFSQAVLAVNTLPEYSSSYDPGRDPFKDGAAAIKLAKQTNRRVLIEVGGEWCSWCHILDDFLAKNPDINKRLHETFVMLKVNVSEANDNSRFLKAFPDVLGYPHMYITDNNGAILWSKDTADFLVDGQHSRQKFTDFFNHWTTNPIISQ